MLNTILESASLVLLGTVICHGGLLHFRITRLRRALAEAGEVLPAVDAAMTRLGETAGGFARRVQNDLETVDARLTGARRTAADLAAASRAAEELASQLDRQLRQTRRLEGARAAAIPRELVEPKGLAERAGLPPAQPLPPIPAPAEVAPAAERPGRLVRMNIV
jgi:hypothetical protein